MNDPSKDQARQDIVAIARAMLSGTLDLVSGCRQLCDLRHRIEATESDLFSPIIGFESETDDYPVGAARAQYQQKYLRQVDEQMEAYLAEARPAVLAACRKLIDSLG